MYLYFADEDGAYYWHVKSGTIQREPPPPPPPDYTAQRSLSSDVSNFSYAPPPFCSALPCVKDKPGIRPACTSTHVTTHVSLSKLQQLLVFIEQWLLCLREFRSEIDSVTYISASALAVE